MRGRVKGRVRVRVRVWDRVRVRIRVRVRVSRVRLTSTRLFALHHPNPADTEAHCVMATKASVSCVKVLSWC